MNKLLLVSSGLGALRDFVEHDPKDTKLVFIPTAGNTSKDPWWVNKDRETLKQMGFQFSEFDIADKSPHQLAEALTGTQVVFVAGGNTFYLLDKMQRCGFAHRMSVLLDSGTQYVGGSAGAVVAGPDIEPVRSLDDPEDAPNLETTKGLSLVNFVVIPHVNMDERQDNIEKIKREFGSKFELVPIHDEQAVVVNQFGKFKVVESK